MVDEVYEVTQVESFDTVDEIEYFILMIGYCDNLHPKHSIVLTALLHYVMANVFMYKAMILVNATGSHSINLL